jgi:hypothetical protein
MLSEANLSDEAECTLLLSNSTAMSIQSQLFHFPTITVLSVSEADGARQKFIYMRSVCILYMSNRNQFLTPLHQRN